MKDDNRPTFAASAAIIGGDDWCQRRDSAIVMLRF